MKTNLYRFFKSILLSCLLLLNPVMSKATPVDSVVAVKIAQAQITRAGKSAALTVQSVNAVRSGDLICFYAATLSPAGFILVSADDALPPVIAYSYQDALDADGRMLNLLKNDISLRLLNLNKLSKEALQLRKAQWTALLSGAGQNKALLQQWPPAGSTTTGGWLETNWTQSAPYNQMCPMDTVTGSRSYVGCPATAMAQILNYHKTTNHTQFSNSDDYNHSYAGRIFNIDDDYSLIGFPSFPELNVYLDTLNAHFVNNILPTNQDKAALSFACGVAAQQVYTSEGSGTFGVNQALTAYHRFGCASAELLLDSDTTLYQRLAQNMKDSLPAHLAIVDPSWASGHNVVIDGYNTDNYFHVNFGWGGSSNGWYLLPDQMPMSLTVVEGLIVDILKEETAAVPDVENSACFSIYPNPAHSVITISTQGRAVVPDYHISIVNMVGQTVFETATHLQQTQVYVDDLGGSGIYIVKICDFVNGVTRLEKIIVE